MIDLQSVKAGTRYGSAARNCSRQRHPSNSHRKGLAFCSVSIPSIKIAAQGGCTPGTKCWSSITTLPITRLSGRASCSKSALGGAAPSTTPASEQMVVILEPVLARKSARSLKRGGMGATLGRGGGRRWMYCSAVIDAAVRRKQPALGPDLRAIANTRVAWG